MTDSQIGQLPQEKLAALIDADRKLRAENAYNKIVAALREENCEIVGIAQIVDGRIVAIPQVVAK